MPTPISTQHIVDLYTLMPVTYIQWFIMVFEIVDFQNAVTLKTELGSVKVIGNITIRQRAYDFLLTFYSNYGSISCRF